jgi:hypothetical protein
MRIRTGSGYIECGEVSTETVEAKPRPNADMHKAIREYAELTGYGTLSGSRVLEGARKAIAEAMEAPLAEVAVALTGVIKRGAPGKTNQCTQCGAAPCHQKVKQ